MGSPKLQLAILATLGGVGFLLFAALFSLTLATPAWVEDYAASFIEERVTSMVDESIDAIPAPTGAGSLAQFAQSMLERNDVRIAELRQNLKDAVHIRLTDAIAQVRDLDCACRAQYTDMLERGVESRIELLQIANDEIIRFIQFRYMSVTVELKRDIRIFSSANAAVFLLLLLVTVAKPRALAHLFVPGVLLAASAMFCSYFYLFEQDWFLTIIYSDYLGYGYLGWLALAFAFLCDIVLNKARLTTELINATLQNIGSAILVAPC